MLSVGKEWPWKWDRSLTDFVPSRKDFIDVTGQVFGKLTALYPIGTVKTQSQTQTTKWVCLCHCGTVVERYRGDLVRVRVPSCGCMLRGPSSVHWDGYEEIPMNYLNNLWANAKKRNLPVEIGLVSIWLTYEDQGRRCALSGLPISFLDSTASVDRIDSSKGYLEDNIQIVHKTINKLKPNLSDEHFIGMCTLVANWIHNRK